MLLTLERGLKQVSQYVRFEVDILHLGNRDMLKSRPVLDVLALTIIKSTFCSFPHSFHVRDIFHLCFLAGLSAISPKTQQPMRLIAEEASMYTIGLFKYASNPSISSQIQVLTKRRCECSRCFEQVLIGLSPLQQPCLDARHASKVGYNANSAHPCS
jgi:hypothetical protein